MIPADGSRAPKSVNRLTNGRASGRAIRPAAGVVTGRWNECIRSPDGSAADRAPAHAAIVGRISGLRMLAIVLAGLWLALAVSVLVAYHPGGPYDLLVRAAIFIPVPIAMLAVVFPPVGHDQRESAAIGWLGLIDVLLLLPLFAGVFDTLRNEARQALFPSAEVAYAAVLTLAFTSLFAAL